FRDASNEDIQQWRRDAMINSAIIFERLQQYQRAANYYERAAEMLPDPADKRNAHYRVAEMAFKRRDWRGAISEMQSFINRYQGQSGSGDLVVQAYWRIAQARQELRDNRGYTTA